MPLYQPSSSASAITIKDEGAALTTAASSIDFVGAGVTASGTTADKTITIPGGSNQLASIAAASAAIANTETVVVSTSLAANYLTAGMSFRIRAAGVGTTGAAAGASTFRIRIGTTTLTGNIPTSVAPTANDSVTAQPFSFEAIVTCRTTGATGTIIGECQALGDNASTGLFTTLNDLSATTATVVVDTTATKLLELTFQSGSAGSSCVFHNATIEVLSAGATGSTAAASCLVYHNTTQVVNLANILFNSEVHDTDGFHDTATNTDRLTVPSGLGGKYLLEYGTSGTSVATTEFCRIRLNNTTIISTNGAITNSYITGMAVYTLAAGDFVTVQFTGNRTLGHASAYEAQSHFSITRLGS